MPDEKGEKPGKNKWAVMGGIALNVEYTRKFGFDATAAAKVTATLVAVPAPAAFQEALLADAAGRARRAVTIVTTLPTTGTPTTPPAGNGTTPTDKREPKPGEEQEGEVLSLLVPEAAGIAYTLDDGVAPISSGRVDEDGVLLHPVSPGSTGAKITFAGRSEPVVLAFEQAGEDELGGYDLDEELLEQLYIVEPEDESRPDVAGFEEVYLQDEQTFDAIEDRVYEDDAPVLSLMVPDKANTKYTLDDGIDPAREGTVDADGLLVHPVSPAATAVTLKFEGDTEAVQLNIAAE